MEIIHKYFKNLSDTQIDQLTQLDALYRDWNSKINVISRKDIDNLYTNHVLHGMALAKIFEFKPGSSVLDVGTGGGFPGVPLAILFPQTKFFLADSIAKKIKVTDAVATAIGLKNVKAKQQRVEELKKTWFDFVVTRAVAPLDKLMQWSQKLIGNRHQHGQPNGLWALKGHNDRLREEIKALGSGAYTEVYPLSDYFEEPFFETKCIVYVQG